MLPRTSGDLFKRAIRHTAPGAITKVYPFAGYDPINQTVDGKLITDKKDKKAIREYYENTDVMWASIFGLPNERAKDGKFSWSLVPNRLMGWSDDNKEGKTIINNPESLFVLGGNLLFVAYTSIVNTIKLGTELLFAIPYEFFKNLTAAGYLSLRHSDEIESSGLEKFGIVCMMPFTFAGWVIFESLFIAGQAITSPLKGVRFCSNLGEQIAEAILGKDTIYSKELGSVLGGVLGFTSAAISAAALAGIIIFAIPATVAIGTAILGAGASAAAIFATSFAVIAAAGMAAVGIALLAERFYNKIKYHPGLVSKWLNEANCCFGGGSTARMGFANDTKPGNAVGIKSAYGEESSYSPTLKFSTENTERVDSTVTSSNSPSFK